MSSNYHLPSDAQSLARLAERFGGVWSPQWAWPSEVLPTLAAPALRVNPDAASPHPEAFLGQFGLLPHWARDPTLARKTYNARAETVHDKPNFRDAWRKGQRCIIPVLWLYEPSWDSGKPVRWKIRHADASLMAVAGLWSRWWTANGAEVMSFSMLTVNADQHPLMQRFHRPEEDETRMVVLLDAADHEAWLRGTPEQAHPLMRAPAGDRLVAELAPRHATR